MQIFGTSVSLNFNYLKSSSLIFFASIEKVLAKKLEKQSLELLLQTKKHDNKKIQFRSSKCLPETLKGLWVKPSPHKEESLDTRTEQRQCPRQHIPMKSLKI
jgi:hypothetical protein